MKEYFELFFSFLKIGAITFGGGYAMLPMIEREIVDKKKWATNEEILDYFAVAQCTPGVIAVNTATFIGYKRKKILGGIIATLGVVFVPVIIICIIATAIKTFSHLTVVKNALWGISVAVCATILTSLVKMAKKSIVDYICLAVFFASFFVSVLFGVSPVVVVLICAFLGIIIKKNVKTEKNQGDKNE